MDLSFEFSILLNLNKGIDLRKIYKLEKSTPTTSNALLKYIKKSLVDFFS